MGKVAVVTDSSACVPQEAERLKADILSQFDCIEFYVTDFTPVVGTHTGPGSIGLSFYTADSK
jgi:fatty acid-binding protein DegV